MFRSRCTISHQMYLSLLPPPDQTLEQPGQLGSQHTPHSSHSFFNRKKPRPGKIKTYTGTSPPLFSKKAMPWGKKWPVQMNLPFFAVKAYVPGGVQNQAEKNSKNAFRPVPVQIFTFPEPQCCLMSVIFPPGILGPEMAAPILWPPGNFWFLLSPIKFLVLGGGLGFLLEGGRGGSDNFIFMGVGIFRLQEGLQPACPSKKLPKGIRPEGCQESGFKSGEAERVERYLKAPSSTPTTPKPPQTQTMV